eukprot:355635-Chlamydomonas_euryale.AAC.8
MYDCIVIFLRVHLMKHSVLSGLNLTKPGQANHGCRYALSPAISVTTSVPAQPALALGGQVKPVTGQTCDRSHL